MKAAECLLSTIETEFEAQPVSTPLESLLQAATWSWDCTNIEALSVVGHNYKPSTPLFGAREGDAGDMGVM